METKLKEIKCALKNGLYNCALALTLTLPDICAKAENLQSNGTGRTSGEEYKKWFDKYAKPYFTYETTVLPTNEKINMTTIDGELCWELRCAVLHAGNYIVGSKPKLQKIEFHAHRPGGDIWEHEVIDGDRAYFDVIKFCTQLCSAVEGYYLKQSDKRLFHVDEINILEW